MLFPAPQDPPAEEPPLPLQAPLPLPLQPERIPWPSMLRSFQSNLCVGFLWTLRTSPLIDMISTESNCQTTKSWILRPILIATIGTTKNPGSITLGLSFCPGKIHP